MLDGHAGTSHSSSALRGRITGMRSCASATSWLGRVVTIVQRNESHVIFHELWGSAEDWNFARSTTPPSAAGKRRRVSSRAGSDWSACSARGKSGTRRRDPLDFPYGFTFPSANARETTITFSSRSQSPRSSACHSCAAGRSRSRRRRAPRRRAELDGERVDLRLRDGARPARRPLAVGDGHGQVEILAVPEPLERPLLARFAYRDGRVRISYPSGIGPVLLVSGHRGQIQGFFSTDLLASRARRGSPSASVRSAVWIAAEPALK
jgi:hypothetical protein